jgi:hypothetical protein
MNTTTTYRLGFLIVVVCNLILVAR